MDRHERRAGSEVYQPAEDSQLLADAAAETIGTDDRVLDVGTGSGYVGARLREEVGARVVGVDPNPHACAAATQRGLPVVRGDLVGPFQSRVFDAVVCNPPYLPTSPEAERDDWMARALSGGETGRAVIDPLLDDAGRVLAPDGVLLVLVSSLTGIEDVLARARRNGLAGTTVSEDSFPFETLSVIRFARE